MLSVRALEEGAHSAVLVQLIWNRLLGVLLGWKKHFSVDIVLLNWQLRVH